MSPSGIPIDGLTHINFAFAYIEPETYKVTTMDSQTPADLFQGVADVASFKSGNEDLEVFVAIGGWTFSDNDTVTQPLFGEIAADAGKRQTFANNLVAFMELYGFDGVDLDWSVSVPVLPEFQLTKRQGVPRCSRPWRQGRRYAELRHLAQDTTRNLRHAAKEVRAYLHHTLKLLVPPLV